MTTTSYHHLLAERENTTAGEKVKARGLTRCTSGPSTAWCVQHFSFILRGCCSQLTGSTGTFKHLTLAGFWAKFCYKTGVPTPLSPHLCVTPHSQFMSHQSCGGIVAGGFAGVLARGAGIGHCMPNICFPIGWCLPPGGFVTAG